MTVNITSNVSVDLRGGYICDDCAKKDGAISAMTAWRFYTNWRGRLHPSVIIKYCPICGGQNIRRATEEEQAIIKREWEKEEE
ncbi:MAG: hypothetical protein LBP76_09525 [Treponema sp.]|jgi:hypothetical protein|nr:hypothetical protein [Treponema sp.]